MERLNLLEQNPLQHFVHFFGVNIIEITRIWQAIISTYHIGFMSGLHTIQQGIIISLVILDCRIGGEMPRT